jgi:hypothetical protein
MSNGEEHNKHASFGLLCLGLRVFLKEIFRVYNDPLFFYILLLTKFVGF